MLQVKIDYINVSININVFEAANNNKKRKVGVYLVNRTHIESRKT